MESEASQHVVQRGFRASVARRQARGLKDLKAYSKGRLSLSGLVLLRSAAPPAQVWHRAPSAVVVHWISEADKAKPRSLYSPSPDASYASLADSGD